MTEIITTIFLDRDGVLLKPVKTGKCSERAAWTLGEYKVTHKSIVTLKNLENTGLFQFFIITNQPDVARGHLKSKNLELIHKQLIRDFPMIKGIYVCVHDYEDLCSCRKPKIDLLKQCADQHTVNLSNSWFIGDRWIDIKAGKDAGIQTILIERPISWLASGGVFPPKDLIPDFTVSSIEELGDIIINKKN